MARKNTNTWIQLPPERPADAATVAFSKLSSAIYEIRKQAAGTTSKAR